MPSRTVTQPPPRTARSPARRHSTTPPRRLAWKAVKEFLENEGALPKSIEWIANSDLPPNTFPEP